jgi:FkbM family methyltransferase
MSLISLLLYKEPKDFFFVQIGANDGKKNDPLYDLVLKYKLSGLLVEPLKNEFENLLKNYSSNGNLIFENSAISNKDGLQSIYEIKKDFQDIFYKHTGEKATMMTSFNKDHVRKFLRRGMGEFFKDKQADDYIDEVQVKTISFDTLMQKHQIKNIDLLQIDTEGFDFEIIKMVDFDKYSPKLINYESVHLNTSDKAQCESLLKEKGYVLFNNKADTYAIKKP